MTHFKTGMLTWVKSHACNSRDKDTHQEHCRWKPVSDTYGECLRKLEGRKEANKKRRKVKEGQRKELLLSLRITIFIIYVCYKFTWSERPETLLHEIPDSKHKAK
jgi:hypothetical protein